MISSAECITRGPIDGSAASHRGRQFPIIRPLVSLWSGRRCEMKAYMCVICGYVYEEEKGDPASGIAAGTRWDDVPLSWRCPDCGAGKEDFEMVEV